MNPPLTPRARARAQAIDQIKGLAWEQVARSGAPALSLRAIARELGIVSSALYRYFPSREALLTALIIDAYADLATTLRAATAAARATPAQHWADVCTVLRAWARAEPHRFALIYGTPVPGYAAPVETIEPATDVMVELLRPATAATGAVPAAPAPDAALTAQLQRLADSLGHPLPAERALAAVAAVSQVFGTLMLELGGHLIGTFDPADAVFDATVARTAWMIGL